MFFLSVLAWHRQWFHIYGYPLPIRMGLKHQNPPELVSLRLWMVAAVIVFISPIIALHEYTSGDWPRNME